MPASTVEPARLRLTNRSMVVAVLLVGVTFGIVSIFTASTRVLGWLAVAVVVAGLLHPLVVRVSRVIPQGFAVAVVAVGTLASIGVLVYSGIDEVRQQASALEREAPKAARELERSDRYGDLAREFHLADKVETFVDELPDRLRGGDAASALRSAATRGVAFLATSVLTLFMLVHGQRIVASGLAQIRDDRRRERLTKVVTSASRRAVRYACFTGLRSFAAGFFVWAVSAAVNVPGASLLGITVGVTSLVPMFGMLVGSMPVLLLAAAFRPERVALVAALVVLYQVGEVLLVQRRIERASLHIGPVLSLVPMMAGLELYGLGGMIGGLAVTVLAASFVLELAPSEESDLFQAADEILAGDEPGTAS